MLRIAMVPPRQIARAGASWSMLLLSHPVDAASGNYLTI